MGDLKKLVRENLLMLEADQQIKAEYTEIRNALKGVGAPSQADIMKLAGLGEVGDKTAESLFSKKLRRKSNDEGGIYQFDELERASIIKAINTAKKS
jgi:hypothetical protein